MFALCAFVLVCVSSGQQYNHYAYGPGTQRAILTMPTQFTIQAVNIWDGTNMTVGGSMFRVQMVGPNGLNKVRPSLTDNLDGTYTCSYVVPNYQGDNSGNFILTITGFTNNAQVAIQGSPYLVSVVPPSANPVDPASCVVAPVPSQVTAGETFYFTIFVKDNAGAVSLSANESFKVTVSEGVGHVVYKYNDQYGGDLYTTSGPSVTVSITLNGVHVPGSPFLIHVLAGAPFPPHFPASGTGVTEGLAGSHVAFTIAERDHWDNQRSTTGNVACTAAFQDDDDTVVTVSPAQGGTWTGSYVMPPPGRHYLNVACNGTPISGSPFSVVSYSSPIHSGVTSRHVGGALFGSALVLAGAAAYWHFSKNRQDAVLSSTKEAPALF